MNRYFRTVLGDVPMEQGGICYSHEHVVIQGALIKEKYPELVLNDLGAICQELKGLRELGVRTMMDAMPTDAGRSALGLAEVSKRSGMSIVASTGLHLRMYYPSEHWYDSIEEDALTEKMTDEIVVGMIDDGISTGIRAGMIKVAGSFERLSEQERRNFRSAGRAQSLTGCAVLTHTERGTAALEQVRLLGDSGADLSHVVLSHLDRNPDIGYHREVLATGVRLEFDSAFRWKGKDGKKGDNQTLDLLTLLAPEYPNSFVLGMDAAKPSYWRSYGGHPGLDYLLVGLKPQLHERGLSHELIDAMFIQNPASAYAFTPPSTGEQKNSSSGQEELAQANKTS